MQRLKGYTKKLGCGLGVSLALSSLGALPARAQDNFPVPVPPPATGDLPTVIKSTQPSPPVPVLVPVTPGAAPGVAQAGIVNHSALIVPTVMKQLLSGQLTAQQAWDKGALRLDDLFYIFSTYIDDWGGLDGQRNVEVRHALMALLVDHSGARLEPLAKVPAKVRLWLADYYESIRDLHTISVAESILAEIKTPVHGQNPLVFQTIERLAWYYRDTGNLERALKTWLRMEPLHADAGWWLPDALVEAGRLALRLKDERQAKSLFARVPQYGDGWITGASLYFQAVDLIKSGRYTEAQQLLKQPVVGGDSDQIQVVLLATLASAYYHAGEFKESHKYSTEALSRYGALSNEQRQRDVASHVNMAQAWQWWSEQWMTTPITYEPRELSITNDDKENQAEPIMRRLILRSFHSIPLTVTINNPLLKAELMGKERNDEYFCQNEVLITLVPKTLKKSFEAMLLVTSPQIVNFQLKVPIHVEAQAPIQCAKTVLFDSVKAGGGMTRILKLSSSVPFHILNTQFSNAAFQSTSNDGNEAGTEHTLNLQFTAQATDKFQEGKLHVVTDLPEQEVVEVSLIARVE